jgi:hypothetical protein
MADFDGAGPTVGDAYLTSVDNDIGGAGPTVGDAYLTSVDNDIDGLVPGAQSSATRHPPPFGRGLPRVGG